MLKKPAPAPEDIVIVAIDEPSLAEIGKQLPWPRSIHAKLIDVLKREGASVIGFDILFSEPSQLDEDTILADSIKKAGNVCLASDIEVLNNKKYIQEIVIEPLQKLKTGAFTGLVSLYIDRDNIVREFYSAKEGEILFAEQIARMHSKKVFPIPENALISYVGPPGSFTTVSYYQALNPSVFLPENIFKNKIVIVGMLLKTVPEPEKSHSDIFATPFLISKNRRLMKRSRDSGKYGP